MIIELVGPPGSGKTTLAGKLRERGAVVVGAPPRLLLVVRAFRFMCRNPRRFVHLAVKTLRMAPKALRYTLFVNLILVHAAKWERALELSQKGKIAVIDQGFFQNLLAAFPTTPSRAELLCYAYLLPLPDVLMHVSVLQGERKKQLAQRGNRPREEHGVAAAEQLDTVACETATHLSYVASALALPYAEGSAKHLSHIELPKGGTFKASLRDAAKHLSYALLSFIRLFVGKGQEAVILMYHAIEYSPWRLAVSPRVFREQMEYLSRHDLAVSLSELIAGTGKRRAVAVTFDDGYRDLFYVLPIIERYRIPITVFVPSDMSVETSRDERSRLSAEELQILASAPLVSIESHARTHRKFTELSAKEALEEAKGSADELENLLHMRPRFFAYPYGARTEDTDAIIAKAGYDAAVGITDGLVSPNSPRFALPRVQVDATTTPFLFQARLTRAVAWYHKGIKLLRHATNPPSFYGS